MKITIYGAGAIGTWLAVALSRAGIQPSVIARGATLAAVQADGLRQVEGPDSAVAWQAAVQATDDPAALGAQDLVIVAVKAPSLPGVVARIGPLVGAKTTVLTAMNGVPWWFLEGGFGGPLEGRTLEATDPGGAIAARVPISHVVGSVVHTSCSLDAPGVVRRHSGNGLILGEPDGRATPRLRDLIGLFQAGGIDARASERIQKDVWYKLWGNMTINPISAITGATADRIVGDPDLCGFIVEVMKEAKAIGEAIGASIPESPESRLDLTRKIGAFKTSMLQDAEAGRLVELDALVTAVQELGRAADLPTPFTDALLGLARVRFRNLSLYP